MFFFGKRTSNSAVVINNGSTVVGSHVDTTMPAKEVSMTKEAKTESVKSVVISKFIGKLDLSFEDAEKAVVTLNGKYLGEKEPDISLTQKGNELQISLIMPASYECRDFGFKVVLPKKLYESFRIESSTGSVKIKNPIASKKLCIKTETAAVDVTSTSENVEIETHTGNIDLKMSKENPAKIVKLKTECGTINAVLNSADICINSNVGNINFDVTGRVPNLVRVESKIGAIRGNFYGKEITLKTEIGAIETTILGKAKTFVQAITTMGKVQLTLKEFRDAKCSVDTVRRKCSNTFIGKKSFDCDATVNVKTTMGNISIM